MITLEEFSKEQGIEVQTKDLNTWKLVLQEKAYMLLEKHALETNENATDGFGVFRGDVLDEYVITTIKKKIVNINYGISHWDKVEFINNLIEEIAVEIQERRIKKISEIVSFVQEKIIIECKETNDCWEICDALNVRNHNTVTTLNELTQHSLFTFVNHEIDYVGLLISNIIEN